MLVIKYTNFSRELGVVLDFFDEIWYCVCVTKNVKRSLQMNKFYGWMQEKSRLQIILSVMFWIVAVGCAGALLAGYILSHYVHSWLHPAEGLIAMSCLAGVMTSLFSWVLGAKLGTRFWVLRSWGLASEVILLVMMAPLMQSAHEAANVMNIASELNTER